MGNVYVSETELISFLQSLHIVDKAISDKVIKFHGYLKELLDEGFVSGKVHDRLAIIETYLGDYCKVLAFKHEVAFSSIETQLDKLRRLIDSSDNLIKGSAAGLLAVGLENHDYTEATVDSNNGIFDTCNSIGQGFLTNKLNYQSNNTNVSEIIAAINQEIESYASDIDGTVTVLKTSYSNATAGVIQADHDVASALNSVLTILQSADAVIKTLFGLIANEAVLMDSELTDEDFAEYLTYTLTVAEANSRINDYVGDYDEGSKTYEYNWENIKSLMKTPADQLSKTDYYILATVLSTMTTSDGEIDIDNLQRFIGMGYNNPSGISKYDFRKGYVYNQFCTSTNGKEEYYYIRNTATLSDTFQNVVYTYESLIASSVSDYSYSPNLQSILDCVVNYFPKVEWRKKVYNQIILYTSYDEGDFEAEGNYWDGYRLVLNQNLVDDFNRDCVAQIFISQGMDNGRAFYSITSNTYNNGNVTTTTDVNHESGAKLGDHICSPDEDNYIDKTIQLYVGCADLETSDVGVVRDHAKSQLVNFYKQYYLKDNIGEAIVDTVTGLIPGGSLLTSIKGVTESSTAIGYAKSATNVLKSADVEKTAKLFNEKVAKKIKPVEKVADTGLSVTSGILGAFAEQESVNLNNAQVDNCIKAVNEYSDKIVAMQNMGIRFDTAVVVHDHVKYGEHSSWEISVDKGADKEISVTESNFVFDRDLLIKQYKTIVYGRSRTLEECCADPKFVEEVDELCRDVEEYMSTGQIKDGSRLQAYKAEWNK